MHKTKQYNTLLLDLLSYYLNNMSDAITSKQILEVKECGVDDVMAFKLLFMAYLNIEDNEFSKLYLDKIFNLLDENIYYNDPYYKNIKLEYKKLGKWEIKKSKYKPYELFVCDDFKYENNKLLPQLGFFNKTFYYLAVYYDNRLWMSTTPNEINTMKKPIEHANGKVLTFGLGLGYFAYMCSLKESVTSVTIVEKDEKVIELFKNNILPQFEHKDKINIINLDAYEFLNKHMNDKNYDYVFVDIYHDASYGKDTYFKFRPYETKFKKIKFEYWIMETIKYYL